MSQQRRKGTERAICRACQKRVDLRPDGTFVTHTIKGGARCKGSFKGIKASGSERNPS